MGPVRCDKELSLNIEVKWRNWTSLWPTCTGTTSNNLFIMQIGQTILVGQTINVILIVYHHWYNILSKTMESSKPAKSLIKFRLSLLKKLGKLFGEDFRNRITVFWPAVWNRNSPNTHYCVINKRLHMHGRPYVLSKIPLPTRALLETIGICIIIDLNIMAIMQWNRECG